MDEKLSPERSVRLLRAKAAELEHLVKIHADTGVGLSEIDYLQANVALTCTLLADHIEATAEPHLHVYPPEEGGV